jgi:hypothetical protein
MLHSLALIVSTAIRRMRAGFTLLHGRGSPALAYGKDRTDTRVVVLVYALIGLFLVVACSEWASQLAPPVSAQVPEASPKTDGSSRSDHSTGPSLTPPLLYEFQSGSRYFPKYMLQFVEPVFLWNDFVEYQELYWGDNANGRIKVAGGYLQLEPGKQIWLLYRLGYGTAEFRGMSWGAVPGTDQEKIIGFGDTAEGEFIGFRLDEVTGQLIVEARHHGQIAQKVIPWNNEYMDQARYFVEWNSGKADFVIITPTRSAKVAEITGPSIPDIRLEISVWNQRGTGDIRMGLIKYDKRP